MKKDFLPLIIAGNALKRLGLAELCDLQSFMIPSVKHRRAITVNMLNGCYISLKGVGWVHGPPFFKMSPTYENLWYGLMDEKSAQKEFEISRDLRNLYVKSTQVLGYSEISHEELELMGVDKLPNYSNGSMIKPVVIATKMNGKYRIRDFTNSNQKEWKRTLINYSEGNESIDIAVKNLVRQIYNNIVLYQFNGYTNETLSSDNVTIHGEITDFERIINIQSSDNLENFKKKQKAEAAYFYEIIAHILENTEIDPSQCALYASDAFKNGFKLFSGSTPFEQEIYKTL
jgi:hypothetical protein